MVRKSCQLSAISYQPETRVRGKRKEAMQLDRSTHKALMAHVWSVQDVHGVSFDEALRIIDGDPTESLHELRLQGFPVTRAQLRNWIEDWQRGPSRREPS
jgi:hypothetical protein